MSNLYDAVKNDMRTADLLLWQSNGAVGRLIQTYTKSPYSHASLVIRLSEYEGLERRRFTTESLRHGVVLNLLSRRLEHQNGKCWWFALKPEWNDKRQLIGERALSYVGIPYDFKGIFRFLFGPVSADVTALYCSELVSMAYGFPDAPSPVQLLDYGMHGKGIQIL